MMLSLLVEPNSDVPPAAYVEKLNKLPDFYEAESFA
jgi:hypothetical protein